MYMYIRRCIIVSAINTNDEPKYKRKSRLRILNKIRFITL